VTIGSPSLHFPWIAKARNAAIHTCDGACPMLCPGRRVAVNPDTQDPGPATTLSIEKNACYCMYPEARNLPTVSACLSPIHAYWPARLPCLVSANTMASAWTQYVATRERSVAASHTTKFVPCTVTNCFEPRSACSRSVSRHSCTRSQSMRNSTTFDNVAHDSITPL
jgi:hypothetical protein